jgi:hypothetical protein
MTPRPEVPREVWVLLDKDGWAFDARSGDESREFMESEAKRYDTLYPYDAPHTVHRYVTPESLSEDHEMANGCLSMIRDDLHAFGIDMTATPPMFYNDAMRAALGKAYRQGKEEATPAPALLTDPMSELQALGQELAREIGRPALLTADNVARLTAALEASARSNEGQVYMALEAMGVPIVEPVPLARWLLAAHARCGGGV